MLDITQKDKVSNTIIHAITNTKPLVHCTRKCQLRFLGHILQLPEEEFAWRYVLYIPSHSKGKPWHPWTSYLAYIKHVLGYDESEMAAEEIVTLAKDQCTWRKLVINCPTAEGWWWWWWNGNLSLTLLVLFKAQIWCKDRFWILQHDFEYMGRLVPPLCHSLGYCHWNNRQ